MRLVSLLATLLIASAPAVAQSTIIFEGDPLTLLSGNCPVGFSADRKASPTVAYAGHLPENAGSGVQVRFRTSPKQFIDRATLIIHGRSAATHFDLVAPRVTASRIDTVQVSRPKGARTLQTSFVSSARLSMIEWLEIAEIVYTDGSMWHPSSSAACAAKPSNLVLVTAR